MRKGNGLEVISNDEVDCITIAGMGGALIASILDSGEAKLTNVKRLILQPNLSAKSIRLWLLEHGWQLVAEEILEEDGKIYEILVAEKGEPNKPYHNMNIAASLLMGPFLIEQKKMPFVKKWRSEVANWKRILGRLEEAAENEDNQKKRMELSNKILLVEEVLD